MAYYINRILAASIATAGLLLMSGAVHAAEVDFGCSATENNCDRTFSCPKYERLTHSKAVCNIEGISLSGANLDGMAWDTMSVYRGPEPGSTGSCYLGSRSLNTAGLVVSVPLPLLSQRQLTYGCEDQDPAEWGPGECQILGKATCQPYLGELRIAHLQNMGAPLTASGTAPANDTPVMQGIHRLDRVNIKGETEYYWLITQANGNSHDGNAGDEHDYLRFQLRTNAGKTERTLGTFRHEALYVNTRVAGDTYIDALGHGQSLYVEKNTDNSYTILTEEQKIDVQPGQCRKEYLEYLATNKDNTKFVCLKPIVTNSQHLLQFHLSADLTQLTFVRRVELTGDILNPADKYAGTTAPKLKVFSINKTGGAYRMALLGMYKNPSTDEAGRHVHVFDLPSDWLATATTSGTLSLNTKPNTIPKLTHAFWLDPQQYDHNQGITLTSTAVISISGSSAMPPGVTPTTQPKSVSDYLRSQYNTNTLGINLYKFFFPSAAIPCTTNAGCKALGPYKRLFRYSLASGGQIGGPVNIQRQLLYVDYEDPTSTDGWSYEPEGMYSIGDEIYFGLVIGKPTTGKESRIYRIAEGFFNLTQ